MITVTRLSGDDPLVFDVVVGDADGASRHRVTLTRADLARLAGGRARSPGRSRVPLPPRSRAQGSILARFDVSVIARYFPEFERELPRYLADAK